MNLRLLGWNQHFEILLNEWTNDTSVSRNINDAKSTPARVVCGYGEFYKLSDGDTESLAVCSGRFRHEACCPADYPVVGDWVMASSGEQDHHGIIHHLFPRITCFSRKAAGAKTFEQPISANVDTAFIVTAFGYDFNERRVERYLTLAYECGVFPIIIINKSDTCDDQDLFVKRMEAVVSGVPVIAVSTKTKYGFSTLYPFLTEGKTSVLIGSSGVGKSSIINALSGTEVLETGDVRENGKGRHVTTQRELFVLGNCGSSCGSGSSLGCIIDNPGMREIQLWAETGSEGETFPEIEEIIRDCKFSDCTHEREPGCAVLGALESGAIERKRYESYMKQKKELMRLSKYKGMSKQEMLQKKKDWHKQLSRFTRKLKK